MIRTGNTMSTRFVNAAFGECAKCGGWAGAATQQAQRPLLEKCYVAGMTAKQAGMYLAQQYRAHRAASDLRELTQ